MDKFMQQLLPVAIFVFATFDSIQVTKASVCGSFQMAQQCVRDVAGGQDNNVFAVVADADECREHCERIGVSLPGEEARCCSYIQAVGSGLCEAMALVGIQSDDVTFEVPIMGLDDIPLPGTPQAAVCKKRAGQKNPHVLLVIVDDAGYNDFDWSPGNAFVTPTLRRLANKGVFLHNHYSCPVCAPSRFTLHTGRHAVTMGLSRSNINPQEGVAVDQKYQTLAEAFKARGYATYGYGKWHLGHGRKISTPGYRGYDYYYGGFLGSNDHFTHVKSIHPEGNRELRCSGVDLRRCEGKKITTDYYQGGVYSTTLFTNEAVASIKAHDIERKSGFFYVSYNAPHRPYQAPDNLISQFNTTTYPGNTERGVLAAMMLGVDEGVASIISALKEKEMWQDTITVFMSDNGGSSVKRGREVVQSNYPLRGGKATLFEGGSKTCAFIHTFTYERDYQARWKSLATSRTGRNYLPLFFISDWMSTLLDASGVPLESNEPEESLGSISHWETLTTEELKSELQPREEILHQLYESPELCTRPENGRAFCGALRQGDWKVVLMPSANAAYNDWVLADEQIQIQKTSVTTVECLGEKPPQYETEHCLVDKPCLFNLKLDPCEYKNVADQHPEIFRRLDDRLEELLAARSEKSEKPAYFSDGCTAVSIWGDWGLWLDEPFGKYRELREAAGFGWNDILRHRVFHLWKVDIATCVAACNSDESCKGLFFFVQQGYNWVMQCIGMDVYEGEGAMCPYETCKSYGRIRWDDGTCQANDEPCQWNRQCCSNQCNHINAEEGWQCVPRTDGNSLPLDFYDEDNFDSSLEFGGYEEPDPTADDGLRLDAGPPTPAPTLLPSQVPCGAELLDNYIKLSNMKPRRAYFAPISPVIPLDQTTCLMVCRDTDACTHVAYHNRKGMCGMRQKTKEGTSNQQHQLYTATARWDVYQKLSEAECEERKNEPEFRPDIRGPPQEAATIARPNAFGLFNKGEKIAKGS
eukprot:m.83323 g.83323  ORF g.83323 m.83323 type:complete len:980 (+) comp25617_c0_seq1:503-3442(+)